MSSLTVVVRLIYGLGQKFKKKIFFFISQRFDNFPLLSSLKLKTSILDLINILNFRAKISSCFAVFISQKVKKEQTYFMT